MSQAAEQSLALAHRGRLRPSWEHGALTEAGGPTLVSPGGRVPQQTGGQAHSSLLGEPDRDTAADGVARQSQRLGPTPARPGPPSLSSWLCRWERESRPARCGRSLGLETCCSGRPRGCCEDRGAGGGGDRPSSVGWLKGRNAYGFLRRSPMALRCGTTGPSIPVL